ncbi:hypothetical protein JMUB7539_27140 [Staphylococcus aureus]
MVAVSLKKELFPDIQVDENGKFSFDAEKAGFRLQNGETLNFAVVKPITGELLHQGFVSKYIDVYESPEEKKEREFEEKLENTPPTKINAKAIVEYFFKQKTAYEMSASLVGSEMCIRDRLTK